MSDLGTSRVFVPEPISEGPNSKLIRIIGLPVVQPDQFGNYVPEVHGNIDAFDAVHTFAAVWRVDNMLRRAFRAADENVPSGWQWGDSPLEVHPHFSQRSGAWYRRRSKRIEFNYFSYEAKVIYTCRSYDIVAHETAHAVLDAMKPGWYPGSSSLKQTLAIHESFADLAAVFALLDQPTVCTDIIASCRGDLHAKTFLSLFAEQYGATKRPLQGYMRNADNDLRLGDVDRSRRYELSKVLTGAIYDIFVDVFELHISDPYCNFAATLNRVGELVLHRLVDAIIKAPESNATFKDVAEIMISNEQDECFRQIIRRQFGCRGILLDSTGDTDADHLSDAELSLEEFCSCPNDCDS
ncbi:hypothetical protein [Vibrio diabolicus]|uniref:hypothetical protein n=2 Tax=Vibrio TaxID=662 RepID=UPI002494935F|nr:hypothetical protein [Vibrio diabolicus]